ncbi:hypothetical protein BS78_07G087300 [Paspalum vaginatum]|nr:hypothetical protein BS78_07G087300 [Paspalum vaginatum]
MPPPETPYTADEAARGAHVLQLTGYSGLRTCNIGTARWVHQSAAFAVGGYDWVLRFYLDGDDEPGSEGYVTLKLVLFTSHARVRASFNLGLVDHATGRPAFQPLDVTAVFDTTPGHRGRKHSSHGRPRLMTRCELEASPAYLHDDAVAVACVVTVVSGSTTRRARSAPPDIPLPEPEPDLPQHIGELLVSQDGADVTFDVDGEAFAAHRIILAARSPVFEEELYGSPAMETDAHHHVTVRDMRPAVFRALLHFIYTDSVPAMGDLGTDETRELIQHLLVAADRYDMDRLRVVCEHILARIIQEETVASTLVLADRHRCDRLKQACVDFMASSDQVGDDAARSNGEDDRRKENRANITKSAFDYVSVQKRPIQDGIQTKHLYCPDDVKQ